MTNESQPQRPTHTTRRSVPPPAKLAGPRRRLRPAHLRAFGIRQENERRALRGPACRKEQRIGLVAGANRFSAPGGGEVQLIETLRALGGLGVAARSWLPRRDTLDDVDVLHLFGSLREWQPLIAQARALKKRVVLSPIAWFDLASRWREAAPLATRVRGAVGHLVRAALPVIPTWRRRLYHLVDLLLPNSQAEAAQLEHYFGVPCQKIRVVPNGANPDISDAGPKRFADRVGGPGFVLAAGRIEPRKNQLALIRALSGQPVRLVILGDPVPGFADYFTSCRRAARDNVLFLPAVSHDDPQLASALSACGCLALVSWFETPGLVALEAGMSGTPLVLTDRGATQEYFGPLANYVAPNDIAGIRASVMQALKRGRDPALAEWTRQRYTWAAAARVTRDAYATIV